MEGTFEEFLSAMLAYESGWDRERFNAGIIQNWQLDQWAGGTVDSFFPQYSSWGDLTNAEWESMAYRSLNSFGFVGYQFGEALLIDLGYYDDSSYYGNGSSSNTWDGIWTGKNGVNSLEDFMTKEAQETAIREAFGHNLGIIEDGLSAVGATLQDFIGTTVSYTTNGETVPVTVTLTGVLASAHLRGAPAVVDLLLTGALSNDEFGTSILQYMEQFGNYEALEIAELIAYFQDRLTGDEGLGMPGEPGSGGSDSDSTAGADANSADVVIDWAWGTNAVETTFNPATDTIYIGWFNSGHIDVYEENGNTIFAIPSNNQTTVLQGVSLSQLSAANFTIKDSTASQEILALVGDGSDAADGNTGEDSGSNADDDANTDGDTGGNTDDGTGNSTSGVGNGDANVSANTADVVIDWVWGTDVVETGFNPSTDKIYVGWFTSAHIDVSEFNGDTVFSIPSNNQTVTLQGVALSDLSAANFTIRDTTAAQEILALVGAGTGGGNDGETGGNDDGGAGDDSDGETGDNVGDSGPFVGGGQTFTVGQAAVISGFNPATDVLDLGSDSIHNQIPVDTPDGFMMLHMFDSSKSTLLEGVSLGDLHPENFAPIVDAHLQQDLSAVLAYEDGTGLVRSNTVYVRSHEEGLVETVSFNPETDKISFFYLSVRGDGGLNFSVEDTAEGARFFNPLTGQSLTLDGVSFGELDSSHFEWRANQLEDNIAGRMGLDDNVANFTYVTENVFTGKSVEMAGGVDQAPYHSVQGYEDYTGTPIAGGSVDSDSGDSGTGDGGSSDGTGDGTSPITVTVSGGSVTEADPGEDHVHDDGSSHVHDDGHRYITFTVTLETPANEELILSYTTSDGSAVADTSDGEAWDYHTTAGDLTFAVGEQTKTVVVAVHPDTLVEDTETFSFAVSGENIDGTLQATGTIYDNDVEASGDGTDGGSGDGSAPGTGNQIEDVVHVTWDWGAEEIISDFAPSEDLIDFGAMAANGIDISEVDGNLHIEVLENGGHKYVLENTQAEDLTISNLSAPHWNHDVLHSSDGVIEKLSLLGNDDLS
ncbi:hypothetical protein IWQ48_003256 [Labrenzia sp. EL_13]|nr:hypothetical protein [Labrenzia sp. EL_13]